MKKIRTKLILIFLGIALLPLIPIAFLVNDLVRQSYEIGVNPKVETSLQKSVAFSRELYQHRKIQLSSILTRSIETSISKSVTVSSEAHFREVQLPSDSKEWRFLALQFYDTAGEILYQISSDSASPTIISESQFAQLAETVDQKIVLSNRKENRFTAIEKWAAGNDEGYAALHAAMNDDFLETTDRNLQVYQLYQTLSISSASLPRGYLYTFLVIALSIILLTIGIAIRLSRRISEPIGELVKGTQEVGRGNLDYQVQAGRDDEIGELIRHFNGMATELKEFQEKTIYLEKMAAWQEIARRLAHEIKNPLTPIQLTIQEMVDQYSGKDAEYQDLIRECHGIINEEIENLRRLVREFSDFGRLPELHLAESDLNAFIRDIRKLYPHLNIQLQLTDQRTSLQMDEDRIRQVLINLIENASQADSGNRPIIIKTAVEKNFLTVSVTDQGKGIPEAEIEKVFQPYFTTKNSGIGLGLAITRKMIEEHNGDIFVESKVGQGSTFTFKLPI